MGLSLGGVSFSDFEVPASVNFGGAQTLAVHRLPGGVRVIDLLGPDDADIKWQGILTGPEATGRARLLDAMRIAGQNVLLAWDEFIYSVIILDLQLIFNNSWWISYRITCVIVNDPAAPLAIVGEPLLSAVASDLASAALFVNVSDATGAVSSAGNSVRGTAPYAAASVALRAAGADINSSIALADTAIQTDDVPTAVSMAGTLAAAVTARGYVARAAANYAQVLF